MKVLVAGGGIGGLTAAISLRRFGIDVEVYERASELRAAGSALSVMSNALVALDAIGIDLNLEKYGELLATYHVRTPKGRLIREFPFPEVIAAVGRPSVCISRADLQQALLAAADGIPLHLGKTAVGFEVDSGVTLKFADGTSASGDVLIGADGFHSAIRRQLAGAEPAVDSGYLCWLALTPFQHPKFTTGSVQHYWGSGQRFGLIDIGGGRAYWWGTKNMPAERSANWTGGKAEVREAFAGWADEVVRAIEATDEEAIIAVPSMDRPFLEQWSDGPVTLLGDAAHPMLTSLGQGSGISIEDAAVLAHCLATVDDVPTALRRYEDTRRERARALVLGSRSISEFEQSENPVRRPVRDLYFKFMPHRKLVGLLTDSLTFPGLG